MRKIMAVFAHPDDEGAMGGTLAHYIKQGHEVILVCATRGEVGEISDPALATPETLAEVREQELRSACAVLGIQHLEFLDYRDSGMDGTDENNDPRAYINANPDEVKGKLVKLMRDYQPDAVITFEPFGWYGHPDHKITSTWATEAFPLVSDPTAYPEIPNAYQPDYFFHSVIKFSRFIGMMQEAVKQGIIPEDAFDNFSLPEDILEATEAQITHEIDVVDYFDIQQEAMMAHQTQFGENSPFRNIPREMQIEYSSHEHFIQLYPEASADLVEQNTTDLFAT